MSSERRPSMRSFDYEGYQTLRENIFLRIGHLPPETVSVLCTNILVPHTIKSLGVFDNIPGVEEGLTHIKSAYEEEHFKPSSPRIAAKLLDSQAAIFIKSLAEPLLAGHGNQLTLMQFSIFYDFATGIKYTANAVIMAEGRIRGDSEFDLIDKITSSNLLTDPIVNAEASLLLENLTRRAADLLKSDSTGLLLIRSTVQSLENGSAFVPDFITREFSIEGARYAEKAYGIIYPIAERVNKK